LEIVHQIVNKDQQSTILEIAGRLHLFLMKMPADSEGDFSLVQVSVVLVPWLATKKQTWLLASCLWFTRMDEILAMKS
jgi:hypothetical protein